MQRPSTHPSERRQWKRLCQHLPAQRHLIVPKVTRTHRTTAKTVLGRMRMKHQRAQGSITQQALQDALLQAQSCRPTEQQRCAASFLVRALKSQAHVSQQSTKLSTWELEMLENPLENRWISNQHCPKQPVLWACDQSDARFARLLSQQGQPPTKIHPVQWHYRE